MPPLNENKGLKPPNVKKLPDSPTSGNIFCILALICKKYYLEMDFR